MAREAFDVKMKPHVHSDSPWDVFIIVRVMQAHLPDVFASVLPDVFHAKELLGGIQRVVSFRNRRAHRALVTEGDVLTALQQMAGVAERCGRDFAALAAVRNRATRLVQQAREGPRK